MKRVLIYLIVIVFATLLLFFLNNARSLHNSLEENPPPGNVRAPDGSLFKEPLTGPPSGGTQSAP